jgi:hypothetical protein
MRVDANTLDNFVFGQVMQFLGSVVTFARRGLTDLSLQTITERVQSWHTSLSTEKVSFQGENGECDRIVGWEIAKCCDSELKYINKCKLEYSINSKPMKKELDYSKHQFNKISEFDKDVLRIRSERVISSGPTILSAEISGFTERMTIEQKKVSWSLSSHPSMAGNA